MRVNLPATMKSESAAQAADPPCCTLLEWDSNFFGLRIARLQARALDEPTLLEALAWARSQRVDCLYYLAPVDDDASVRWAEKGGFHLVDVRLDFIRRLDRALPAVASSTYIRPAVPADLPQLRAIAARSYQHTRFAFDSHFPRDRVQALYEEWIRRSCEGFAERVLVVELAGMVAGYTSCHLEPGGIGRIGLVGVDEHMRGRGLAPALVDAAIAFFAEAGCTEARVATQARNIVAQRLYQNRHFVTREVGLWYHLWF